MTCKPPIETTLSLSCSINLSYLSTKTWYAARKVITNLSSVKPFSQAMDNLYSNSSSVIEDELILSYKKENKFSNCGSCFKSDLDEAFVRSKVIVLRAM